MPSLRHANSEEVIEQEFVRAAKAAEAAKAAKAASKKPLFLWLKPGQKALIRPLFRMQDTITLYKHNRWNKDRDLNVNAICADELDPKKPCLYCEMAKENRNLTANGWIFLPVYVYQVTNENGSIATYEEKQEDGTKVEKPIKGVVRLLELTAFGRVAPLLKYFKDFPKDPDNCEITECDFTIEQVGEGQAKSFTPAHKNPKPMHSTIKTFASKLTEQDLFDRIIQHCPPKISDGNVDPFADSHPARGSVRDTDPAIEAVSPSEELDETIPDF